MATTTTLKLQLPAWPEWAVNCFIGVSACCVALIFIENVLLPSPSSSSSSSYSSTSTTEVEHTGHVNGSSSSKCSDDTTSTGHTCNGAYGNGNGVSSSSSSSSSLSSSSSSSSSTQVSESSPSGPRLWEFRRFQLLYLCPFLVIMLADWLQGTHMYTLYQSYGVDVGLLFLTGFSSSAVFGTFLGLLVDRWGRRLGCVVFCVLELIINTLEHYPSMPLLLLGRVLGGISTSLLFTSFESWMVSEHRKRGFPEGWLASTFSVSTVGNGVVAVIAGVVAQVSADALGDIGPFQVALALTATTLGLLMLWTENHGESEEREGGGGGGSVLSSMRAACGAITADPRVLLLGLIQSLFEGGMYTFVFMWVPTMLSVVPEGGLPTGLVFSSFMVCITIGGMLFSSMLRFTSVEKGSVIVFTLAAVSMVLPVITHDFKTILGAFLLLETCVGAFFSCSGLMRSKYLPDSLQSSIMNIFRVPLNVFVVVGTKMSDTAPPHIVFTAVALWFGGAAILQLRLAVLASVREEDMKGEGGDKQMGMAIGNAKGMADVKETKKTK